MLIHLKTLGCRLNEAELETWAQGFQAAGHGITQDVREAGLVVLNSCAVTEDAVRKSRQLVRRTHRDNPAAKLVLSGCYATLNETEAAGLLGVDLIVGNGDKARLVQKTLAELNMDSMPSMAAEPGAVALFHRGRQRAFVKVQDGCRYRCTFCIVTVARGEERSRGLAEIVDEINRLQEQGIREAVITGVHLGGYGADIDSNLTKLVTAILRDTDIPRLRLGSLEPWEFSDGFIELFQDSRLLPHLHLPLQSGCDSVLKRMARRCKTEEFAAIADSLRACTPDFNITTDIIVGFPGETEAEWRAGFEFIERVGFGHMHIFSYSPRAGTAAASFPNPVSVEVKKSRSRELHDLAERMKQDFMRQNLGRGANVLWEGQYQDLPGGGRRYFGYTPNYLRAACDVAAGVDLENTISEAVLREVGEGVVLCDPGVGLDRC